MDWGGSRAGSQRGAPGAQGALGTEPSTQVPSERESLEQTLPQARALSCPSLYVWWMFADGMDGLMDRRKGTQRLSNPSVPNAAASGALPGCLDCRPAAWGGLSEPGSMWTASPSYAASEQPTFSPVVEGTLGACVHSLARRGLSRSCSESRETQGQPEPWGGQGARAARPASPRTAPGDPRAGPARRPGATPGCSRPREADPAVIPGVAGLFL